MLGRCTTPHENSFSEYICWQKRRLKGGVVVVKQALFERMSYVASTALIFLMCLVFRERMVQVASTGATL
jgi:hypothetical protein